MAYAIKDSVSGKYMTRANTLESSAANATTYKSKSVADAAANRLKNIYDNWEATDRAISDRGYTNAYKAITPTPIWVVQSVK
jgi:hypothetical protein